MRRAKKKPLRRALHLPDGGERKRGHLSSEKKSTTVTTGLDSKKSERPQMCGGAQLSFGRSSSLKSGAPTETNELGGEEVFHSHRRETIRRDIDRRLRRVCPQYSEEELDQLVDQMTDNQLRGERRANRFPY